MPDLVTDTICKNILLSKGKGHRLCAPFIHTIHRAYILNLLRAIIRATVELRSITDIPNSILLILSTEDRITQATPTLLEGDRRKKDQLVQDNRVVWLISCPNRNEESELDKWLHYPS